jgi:hypothetical protein
VINRDRLLKTVIDCERLRKCMTAKDYKERL